MRLLTFLAVAAIASFFMGCGDSNNSSSTSTTTANAGMGGDWKGTLSAGGGGNDTFKIKVTIDGQLEKGQKAAEVNYPGLGSKQGCSGYWNYEGQQGDKYNFHETITRGENKTCSGVGDVALTKGNDANALQYHWQEKGSTASGTLNRTP